MSGVIVLRRVAQVVVVLCAVGCAVIAVHGDWPDAALIGLVGALALVTVRMTTWRLRQDDEWTTVAATASGDLNS
jgi:hypothetical protein